MAKNFAWKCPTCGHPTTVTDPNVDVSDMDVVCERTPKGLGIKVRATLIECPNQDCQAQSFHVRVHHGDWHNTNYGRVVSGATSPVGIGSFTFLPTTAAPLSAFVPEGVLSDYNEAYLIRALSPKASATLARRALQGMVRDFFTLPKLPSLHKELEAIEEKCDPDLYAAMMAVKSIGNIGAHPERDASLMVDVEAGEPEAMLDLINLLDQEWYVARAGRVKRLERVKLLGADKAQAKIPALPAPEAQTVLTGPAH